MARVVENGCMARQNIAIIGAGPGGMAMAVKLMRAGYTAFTIFEQSDRVGGTWHHNSYPGCRCDVPSSLYSFSFAFNADWTERFATQPEILRYMEQVADDFGITPHARFNTALTGAKWLEDRSQWELRLSDGSVQRFDILVGATGMFNVPYYPAIPGLKDFAGPVMHSARWDHSVDLSGKRVALIGAAASAVQIAPAIAPVVGHLDIYQRTPNYVRPRAEYSPEERETMVGNHEAMLQDREMNFHWIDAIATLTEPGLIEESYEVCEANLAQVADPEVRDKMRPNYPFGSKRPLISSDWYPMFNRPNVSLVTDRIARVSNGGVETAAGDVRPADVIVLATGFQTSLFFSAVPIEGAAGQALSAYWQEGVRAYKGITVPGFPNLFMMYGPNTNNGSIIFNLEEQADYVVRHLARMEAQGAISLSVQEDALVQYNRELQADIAAIAPWQGDTSTYYRDQSGLNVTQYPHGMRRYAQMMREDDFAAYQYAAASPVQSARVGADL